MIIHFIVFTTLILFLLLWIKILFDNIKLSNNFILKFGICIALTLIFKFDWGLHFLGLEYEDAYSFSAYARQLSYKIFSNDLRIECIDVGSLSNPLLTSTYGGHFITYPIFLYIFTSLFGFSFTLISGVNTLISFLSILTLAFFFRFHGKFNWLIVILTFCIAPAINVFSTSFLCESFSSFIAICFVLGFLSQEKNPSNYKRVFVFLTFFLAILCKRDNLILLWLPIIYYSLNLWKVKFIKILKDILPYFLIIFLISLFIQNIFLAEIEETKDIDQQTFSLSIFAIQFPVYLKSFFSFKLFTLSFPLYIVLLMYGMIFNRNKRILLSLTTLFIGYFLMYSAHYRGYYFITGEEEYTSFSTIRYINNFFYLIPISIGICVNNTKFIYFPTLCITVILCCLSTYITIFLRENLNEEEYYLRFKAINEINKELPKDAVLITDVPLLFLNLSSPETIICNLSQLNNINLDGEYTYYLYCDDLDFFIKRYNLNLSSYSLENIKIFDNDKQLYKIKSINPIVRN